MTISPDNIPVKRVSHTKSLGMHIDQHLSWNFDELCKNVASGIGALKRLRPFVNSNTLQMIFSGLIQPYFDYCSVVWDGCGTTLAGKIQKLQNRAARVLTSTSLI